MKVAKDVEFDLETICIDDHEGLFTIVLTWWQASLQTWWWGRWWRGNLPRSGSPYLISTETSLMGLLFQSFNATNNGRTFVLLPGLNVTTATTDILITASYSSTVVATYNATCLPGLIP
jgi:hypothetical protein